MGEFLCEIENKPKKSITPIPQVVQLLSFVKNYYFFSFGFVPILVLDIWLVSVFPVAIFFNV